MSAFVSLSGLSAAQKDLNTTSNNIANAGTFGFKESRAEFADVYSNSIFSNGKTTTGGGAQTSVVAQQFSEGSSVYTNNPLDLRISGTGYFGYSNSRLNSGDINLGRNGACHLNDQNYLVNSEGQYLQAFNYNTDLDQVSSYEPQSVKIPDTFGTPKASENIELGMNLPVAGVAHDPTKFDWEDPDTFTNATSSTIYDSLGQTYKLTTYYVRDGSVTDQQQADWKSNYPGEAGKEPNSQWAVFYTVTDEKGNETPVSIDPTQLGNGTAITGYDSAVTTTSTSPDKPQITGQYITFDANGNMSTVNGREPLDAITKTQILGAGTDEEPGAGVNLNGGKEDQMFNISFKDPTQFASPFQVNSFMEDGASTGYLTNVDIDAEGFLKTTYSNGMSIIRAQVAMARVANDQGLAQQGNTQWKETQASGEVLWGSAGTGAYGKFKNGTLEQSNIDMTQELVDLISAQRNFQANSRALEVDNTLQQTILQIR